MKLTPGAVLEHGTLLEHIHSHTKYWYMGKVPDSLTVVVATEHGGNAYPIAYSELMQYYEIAPIHTLEEMKTYKSASGARFTVESRFTHPDDGSTVAFGWYQRMNEGVRIAHSIEEAHFDLWTEDK